MCKLIGLVAHLHERRTEIMERISRKIADLLGLPRPLDKQPVERCRKPMHLVQPRISLQFNLGT